LGAFGALFLEYYSLGASAAELNWDYFINNGAYNTRGIDTGYSAAKHGIDRYYQAKCGCEGQ
jgi:hypothetical protein